jgi:hypothetical protein
MLHLDTRPEDIRARWWRDADGQYHPVRASDLERWAT